MRALRPVELAAYEYMFAVIGRPSARARSTRSSNRVHPFPIAPARGLEVMDLCRDSRLAADADELVHGFEDPRGPSLRRCEVYLPWYFAGDLAELDQLLGLRIRPGE
jgi:hypothetical protein